MVKIRKKHVYGFFKQIISILCSLAVLLPFYMVFINSFKGRYEAARMSLLFPTEWMFSNYLEVIDKGKLFQGFLNSFTYSTVSTLIGVLLSAMAAFVLCRRKTKVNNFIYYFVLFGLFFPANFVTLVKVFQFLHLTDTRIGVILTFTGAMIPFCIFVIRNFVATVPVEMDEAGIIDGAGPLKLFFHVILPLLQPIIATCFILQFMGTWNDFLVPLYLTSKSKMFPMTMSVYQFFGRNTSYWNYIFADIVLTTIPVVAIYLLGQKYFIQGISTGAVKQ